LNQNSVVASLFTCLISTLAPVKMAIGLMV
jgi:hypothetical protein